MSRGLFLYNRGALTEAQGYFEQAAEIDPLFPEVNLSLGAIQLREGNGDSAEVFFSRETYLHPERAKGYTNLASLHLVRGEHPRAVVLSGRALERTPYDVNANTIKLRALAADSTLTTTALMMAIDGAARATGNELSVLNEGASLMVHRGELTEARQVLERALRATAPPIETDDLAFGPNFAHSRAAMAIERAKTYYLLGFCHAQAGELEQAIDHTRRAITGDSTLVEAYVNLYAGFRTRGRLVEADSVLTEAARRFPDHPLIMRLLTP
jgi:Tfp pilus assembly protein PilF